MGGSCTITPGVSASARGLLWTRRGLGAAPGNVRLAERKARVSPLRPAPPISRAHPLAPHPIPFPAPLSHSLSRRSGNPHDPSRVPGAHGCAGIGAAGLLCVAGLCLPDAKARPLLVQRAWCAHPASAPAPARARARAQHSFSPRPPPHPFRRPQPYLQERLALEKEKELAAVAATALASSAAASAAPSVLR